MTTPQNILHEIKYKVNDLVKSLQTEDEVPVSLMETIEDMRQEIIEIHIVINRLADTMALVLKVMNDKGNKK